MNAKKAKALRKTAKVFAATNPEAAFEARYDTKKKQITLQSNTVRWFYKQLKKSDL